MKKTILLLACASMLAGSAYAQSEVESLYKSGKEAFAAYDKDFAKTQLSQPVDTAAMLGNLMKGFKDFEAALPLDSVKTNKIDKKTGLPKVKTKYSKEMVALMAGHIGDLTAAGNMYYTSKQYAEGAYAFGRYCELIQSPMAKANNVQVPADTILGQIRFFEGLCDYYIPDYKKAFTAFDNALKLGYTGKEYNLNIADYKADCFSKMLQPLLDAKEFDKAYAAVDKAIAAEPNNSAYYYMKGALYASDSTKNVDDAIAMYKKSVELNPKNADANFNVGYYLWKKGQEAINAAPANATNDQIAPQVVPVYKEALPYLQKALEINPEYPSVKAVIENINYGLGILDKK